MFALGCLALKEQTALSAPFVLKVSQVEHHRSCIMLACELRASEMQSAFPSVLEPSMAITQDRHLLNASDLLNVVKCTSVPRVYSPRFKKLPGAYSFECHTASMNISH